MKIVVDHLTRMQSGYFCVAGVDIKTKRHVRPMPVRGHLRGKLLASHGGPFDMGAIVDLGPTTPIPERPQVEDVSFEIDAARNTGILAGNRFWNMVTQLAQPKLTALFGVDLQQRGSQSCAVDCSQGVASLGLLAPTGRPEIYLRPRNARPSQIRLRVSDGDFNLDLGVTDLRLYRADRLTPDEDAIERTSQRLATEHEVVVSVGLTRPYAPKPDAPKLHWLQANNLHFREDAVWQLIAAQTAKVLMKPWD